MVVTGWDQEGVLSGTVTLDNGWGGVVELLLCLELFDIKQGNAQNFKPHLREDIETLVEGIVLELLDGSWTVKLDMVLGASSWLKNY